jgi:hypothetical protein
LKPLYPFEIIVFFTVTTAEPREGKRSSRRIVRVTPRKKSKAGVNMAAHIGPWSNVFNRSLHNEEKRIQNYSYIIAEKRYKKIWRIIKPSLFSWSSRYLANSCGQGGLC